MPAHIKTKMFWLLFLYIFHNFDNTCQIWLAVVLNPDQWIMKFGYLINNCRRFHVLIVADKWFANIGCLEIFIKKNDEIININYE